MADELPEDFAKDRGRLYLGPNFDLKREQADLPHIIAQIRPQLGWMDQRLATGRSFMLGDQPGLPDALTYPLIWFIRGRWAKGPAFLSQFPALCAWEQRVKEISHGQPKNMESGEALDVALTSEIETPECAEPNDPQALYLGQEVEVLLDGDGGDPAVRGKVHCADKETIAIVRNDDRVGRVCVHFPRVGFRIRLVE